MHYQLKTYKDDRPALATFPTALYLLQQSIATTAERDAVFLPQ